MLTSEQEKWLAHLNDTDSVRIYPADLDAKEKFERIKKMIQTVLGNNIDMVHKGATSLEISGQGELDIYIPVVPLDFDPMVASVKQIFGNPRSLYPQERARFVTSVDGIKAEVFVINKEGQGWRESCAFENYLKQNREALDAYRKLKEEGEGLSTQKYYKRKIEFINQILRKTAILES